jgi:hypothetical protein
LTGFDYVDTFHLLAVPSAVGSDVVNPFVPR